jgi:hypothetical protein
LCGISSLCPCVTFKTSSESWKAGGKGYLELSYKPTKITSKPELISVFSNASKQNFTLISLQGVVVEDFIQESLLKQTKKNGW